MSQQTQYIRVLNTTGQTIRQGAITHATKEYGVQTIPLKDLADGQYTATISVYTGPSRRDYWYICWTNDGENWVAWSGRNAIHGHESSGAPGTVALRGLLGNSALQVVFTVDGDTNDKEDIKNPW